MVHEWRRLQWNHRRGHCCNIFMLTQVKVQSFQVGAAWNSLEQQLPTKGQPDSIIRQRHANCNMIGAFNVHGDDTQVQFVFLQKQFAVLHQQRCSTSAEYQGCPLWMDSDLITGWVSCIGLLGHDLHNYSGAKTLRSGFYSAMQHIVSSTDPRESSSKDLSVLRDMFPLLWQVAARCQNKGNSSICNVIYATLSLKRSHTPQIY